MQEQNEVPTNSQTPTGLSSEAPNPTIQERRDTKRKQDVSNSNWVLARKIVPEKMGSSHT